MYANPSATTFGAMNAGTPFACNNQGVNAVFQVPRRQNFEHDSFRNVNYTNQFVNDFSKSGYCLNIEEREDTQWNVIDRNVAPKEHSAPQKRLYDRARVTARQTRQSRRNGNLSSVDSTIGSYHANHQYFHARPTHKETTMLRTYKGTARGPDTQQNREQYCNSTSKLQKESNLIGYTPGPRKTVQPQGTCDYNITIKNQLSNEERIHPLQPTVPIQSIRDKNSCGLPTSSTPADKIDPYNEQLTLDIGATNLRGNPFSLTPFYTSI